jgi:hypothetical protein
MSAQQLDQFAGWFFAPHFSIALAKVITKVMITSL